MNVSKLENKVEYYRAKKWDKTCKNGQHKWEKYLQFMRCSNCGYVLRSTPDA